MDDKEIVISTTNKKIWDISIPAKKGGAWRAVLDKKQFLELFKTMASVVGSKDCGFKLDADTTETLEDILNK